MFVSPRASVKTLAKSRSLHGDEYSCRVDAGDLPRLRQPLVWIDCEMTGATLIPIH